MGRHILNQISSVLVAPRHQVAITLCRQYAGLNLSLRSRNELFPGTRLSLNAHVEEIRDEETHSRGSRDCDGPLAPVAR
jgi:hypothetical protein